MKRIALLSVLMLLVINACGEDKPRPPLAPAVMAGNPSARLDQCANGPVGGEVQCAGAAWVNGNVNEQKAHYQEGNSVPYRLVMSDIPTSGSNTVTIEWDVTKNGKHALDYLTRFDQTETTADPCSGVSGCSLSGPKSTFSIPPDANVTNGFNGIDDPPTGPTGGDDIAQLAGVFTLFNGTITAVSASTGRSCITPSCSTNCCGRASCRWLRPDRCRRLRIASAICRRAWPLPLPLQGTGVGSTGAAATSGSSASSEVWQRRQRLLLVRNWTSKQRSHLTTSRESTGARVVAIQVVREARAGISATWTGRDRPRPGCR